MKIGSSRATSASQKPYSPFLGAGSQRQRFQRPTRPVTDARKRSGWRRYGGSAIARRENTNLLPYDFLIETPIVVFLVCLFSRIDTYILGGKPPTSISTSNMVLIDVAPSTFTHRFKQ
jgi:hypothetical protein